MSLATLPSTTSIAIIGAGFAGLGMAIQLRKGGITDFVILERANSIGGVWRDNTYPGAACDIPSHLYSYSFALRFRWSRVYAPQRDIYRYLRECVREYGLARYVHLACEVKSARYDEGRGVWRLDTAAGASLQARALITATGQLNRPAYPAIPGLEEFGGRIFHSARWDHRYDLRRKRVAIIGTGASAIQFTPRVARKAAQVYLFQRSAPYVLPKLDHRFSQLQHRLFDALPFLYRLARAAVYVLYETLGIGFVSWRPAMKPLRAAAMWNLRRAITDPQLRSKLTPAYPFGCKRVLFSNDYYPALARPNVELITAGIESAGAAGLRTTDRRSYEVDAIILGTGFAATELLAPIDIVGRAGVRLADAWRDGPEAYLGIAVAGFPNLFMLYGPNTNLGHNSIIYMLESQIRYVMQAIAHLDSMPGACLEVSAQAQTRYNRRLQQALGRTVWSDGCRSWYMNAQGRLVSNWSGFTFTYRRMTRRFDPSLYELIGAKEPQALASSVLSH